MRKRRLKTCHGLRLTLVIVLTTHSAVESLNLTDIKVWDAGAGIGPILLTQSFIKVRGNLKIWPDFNLASWYIFKSSMKSKSGSLYNVFPDSWFLPSQSHTALNNQQEFKETEEPINWFYIWLTMKDSTFSWLEGA